MSVLDAIRNLFASSATTANGSAYDYRTRVAARIEPVELPPAALYSLLRQAYLSNGFYQQIARAHTTVGRSTPQLRAIRNPIPPVVDFFGAKTFPDPLEVVTENSAIVAPIEQVWRWSNWQKNKRQFARYLALFGEVYTRTVSVTPDGLSRGRVYFEVITPEHVTEFEDDERGYLTTLRLDIPITERDATGTRRFTHTEAWSKERQDFRIWKTEGDVSGRSLDDLGMPDPALSGTLADLGIDFLPFTRTVFRDIGEPRGIGAVQLALEAIVDADISATNLHSMVYQDAEGAWVLRSIGFEPGSNRPLAPPVVGSASADGSPGRQSDDTVTVGKRSFWRLPGNSELQSVVPDIDYDAALAVLKDHDEHLERLMPALAYARISELSGSDLSGRAIRYKLTPAIDQVVEVRSNAVASLVQANMQALTMGRAAGVEGFADVGTFEDGAFEHTIRDTEIIETSDYEQAQTRREQAQAFSTFASAGLPLAENLTRVLEMTEDEAAEVVDMAAQEAETAMERAQQMIESRPAEDEGED